MSKEKITEVYVLYATSAYLETVTACVASLNKFSKLPVHVYTVNFHANIPGAKTIYWECDTDVNSNSAYIDRLDSKIYRLLIQRIMIVLDALSYANTVTYVDSDSVATPYVDSIFSYLPPESTHPYFVEGIYDYLQINGRGGAESKDDLSTTLEHPACVLFDVDQKVRDRYRQTGYFVVNQQCIEFLNEWWWMCNHPEILNNPQHYAPYHEETIVNVLLWKKKIFDGLPYIYINGGVDIVDRVFTKLKINGQHVESWLKMPNKKGHILFFHGEKNRNQMHIMIDKIKNYINKPMRVLFVAPHLSTGGMPAFLLKRIETLVNHVDLYVVEYQNYSDHYVVQKDAIKAIVNNFWTLGENKHELMDIVRNNNIDIVHIDEMVEGFDDWNKVPDDLLRELYSDDRTWRIVETCHNIVFNPDKSKRFHPDAYAFCTPHHVETFKRMPSKQNVITFPINVKLKSNVVNDRKVILNVGLWTPGKNQAEGIEIARKYPEFDFWFVGNQAPNFKDYWEPLIKNLPSNVTIWGERSDVSDFMSRADVFMFNSVWECNPLVLREAISYGLPIIARNLPQYGDMFTPYLQPIDTDLHTITPNYNVPADNDSANFGARHMDLYNSLHNSPVMKQPRKKVNVIQHFIEQPFLEILGDSNSLFEVSFFDENDKCIYNTNIKSNSWVRLNRTWFTKWSTKVWQDGELIYTNTLNLKDRRVYIAFDSASLGDSIAWIPYCLEFKKKHDCHVIVSTFKNFLFKDVYPELEFIEPGNEVPNIYAQYKIGWFYNPDKEPAIPNTVNLQECAANILGIDYQEIIPRINYHPRNKFDGKIVTIATNSTAGCKFWTREGWQEVVTHLVNNGYRVVNVSKEKNPFEGAEQIEDTSMQNTMDYINSSEFFVGLSSGLSWLAWAMGKQVVMISNFTNADHEFSCIRIDNKDVCHGCWNNPNFVFDKGDWNWCPIHKGTDRQFECHLSIKAIDVINKLPI
jgi:autotransporter strand-loop-strand O-heptosyltransferase